MYRKFLKLQRRLEDYDIPIPLLAIKLRVSMPTLRSRLRGASGWRYEEITAICRLTDIRPDQIGEFFFPDLLPAVVKGGRSA